MESGARAQQRQCAGRQHDAQRCHGGNTGARSVAIGIIGIGVTRLTWLSTDGAAVVGEWAAVFIGAAHIVTSIAARSAVGSSRIDARIAVTVLRIRITQTAGWMHAACLCIGPGAGADTRSVACAAPGDATRLRVHYMDAEREGGKEEGGNAYYG